MPEDGSLSTSANWSGPKTRMKLTTETVDYYTGVPTSFGQDKQDQLDTTWLFYETYHTERTVVTVYVCGEVLVNGRFHALNIVLEGAS